MEIAKVVGNGGKALHRRASVQLENFREAQAEKDTFDGKFHKSQKGAKGRRASLSVALVDGVPVSVGLGGQAAIMPAGMSMKVVDGVVSIWKLPTGLFLNDITSYVSDTHDDVVVLFSVGVAHFFRVSV